MNRFFKFQFPLFFWIVLVYWLSSIKSIPVVKSPISLDKVVHIGVYFIFCWFAHRASFHQFRFPLLRLNALLFAIVTTVIYGALDEYHQSFVPGRTSDIADVMADTIGGIAFVLVYVFLRKYLVKEELEAID